MGSGASPLRRAATRLLARQALPPILLTRALTVLASLRQSSLARVAWIASSLARRRSFDELCDVPQWDDGIAWSGSDVDSDEGGLSA